MRGRGTRCDGRGVPRQGIETVAAGRRAYHGMGLAIEEGGRLAGEFWLGAADRNRRQQCMCVCVCVCECVRERKKERRFADVEEQRNGSGSGRDAPWSASNAVARRVFLRHGWSSG
jgi:hypothetical protein